MISLEPYELDLNSPQDLIMDPVQDWVLVLNFGKDMTGATHKITIEPFRWEYEPHYYQSLEPSERLVFDTSLEANGIIKHTITSSDLLALLERRVILRWIVTMGGVTWVACRKTFLSSGNQNI